MRITSGATVGGPHPDCRIHPARGIAIPWVDSQKDLLEIKNPSRIDSDEVKRKRKAAEIWCKRRGGASGEGMEYVVATIKP